MPSSAKGLPAGTVRNGYTDLWQRTAKLDARKNKRKDNYYGYDNKQ